MSDPNARFKQFEAEQKAKGVVFPQEFKNIMTVTKPNVVSEKG